MSGNAPRALRALLVVAIALVMFGLARLLHSTRSPLPAADEATLQSLAPVLAGATDTQACLVLTADKAVLRDDAKQGFVMMQRYGGSLIAMGDPVGPPDVARALIWRFREEADRLGLRPVFYQVGETYWQTYLDLGLGLVKLGEEAIVPLHDFGLEGRERADLRRPGTAAGAAACRSAWHRRRRFPACCHVCMRSPTHGWRTRPAMRRAFRWAATTRITWCASRWHWSKPRARSWHSPTCGRHRPVPSCRWT